MRPNLKEGSVKIVTIDNIIVEKKLFINKRWIAVCKMDKCNGLIYKNELCDDHHKEVYEGAERGDIRIIDGRKMKWDGLEWKKVCPIQHCKKVVPTNRKMCKQHTENPRTFYSPFHDSLKLFNDVSDDFYRNR